MAFSGVAALSFKQTTARIFAALLYYTGLLRVLNWLANRLQRNESQNGSVVFPFVKKRKTGNVQILTYHRVNDENDPFFSGIPIDLFSREMEYLASHFNICSLEDAVELLARKDVPDNTVVITFDDGYRDNYLNAFPVLKKLKLPATIFLATDAIGSDRVLWHDRIFSAFRETREKSLENFGRSSITYPLRTIQEKLFAQTQILNFIRSQTHADALFWIDSLIAQLKVADRKDVPGLMLSWEEVKTMRAGGISFGSHTVSHPILSRLPLERAREEIQKSKQRIEEKLGLSVKAFAYPNGKSADFDEFVKKCLGEAGYTCAVTTAFGSNECGQDPFELRRATPWDRNIPAFGLRLNYYKFCSSRQ